MLYSISTVIVTALLDDSDDDSSRPHLQAGEPRGDLGDLAATWVALGVKVRVRIRVS